MRSTLALLFGRSDRRSIAHLPDHGASLMALKYVVDAVLIGDLRRRVLDAGRLPAADDLASTPAKIAGSSPRRSTSSCWCGRCRSSGSAWSLSVRRAHRRRHLSRRRRHVLPAVPQLPADGGAGAGAVPRPRAARWSSRRCRSREPREGPIGRGERAVGVFAGAVAGVVAVIAVGVLRAEDLRRQRSFSARRSSSASISAFVASRIEPRRPAGRRS